MWGQGKRSDPNPIYPFIFQRKGVMFEKIHDCSVRPDLNHTVFIVGYCCLKLQISGKPNGCIPTMWDQIYIIWAGGFTNGLHLCQA